ncbi:MAG: hypothetical protein VB104_07865 [Candidatus Limiplasma sp.]|nr:hypothetical protein [Candidatus Limiplasma sp.]
MGAELRKIHRESLKRRTALLTYDGMCRERKRLTGQLTEHAELIIYNIAQIEESMEALREDIRKRGEVVQVVNGRQTYCQQNKSLYELTRLAVRQASLSAKLGMAAGNEAAGEEETVEGVDDL